MQLNFWAKNYVIVQEKGNTNGIMDSIVENNQRKPSFERNFFITNFKNGQHK